MKPYSMGSHKRRKHQRWLNAFCREVNKTMEHDPLWMGRFVVEQKRTEMHWFPDNSGGVLWCVLQFRDKKTGQTKFWPTTCFTATWDIWERMNDFIVNDCKA